MGTAARSRKAPAEPDQGSQEPLPSTNGHAPENGEKKKPVWKFGPIAVDRSTNVQVAVWGRELKLPDGKEITVYSATLQCSYLDQQTGQWMNTDFLRGSALPIAAHALMKAWDWILEARNEAKNGAS